MNEPKPETPQNVSTENNRTMILPLPLEFYKIVPALMERFRQLGSSN
ncbi:MAG: hypothetical protein P8184_20990 [Calditrichia bacterium]